VSKVIGITTTVPIEILLAAGYQPVDLNNLFIGDSNPERLIAIAERDGFPQNCCAWIKGIYGVCMDYGIDTVLCVTTGDCSNTIMLMEVLELRHLKVVPFAYPDRPNIYRMRYSLEALAESLGTSVEAAEEVREELAPARHLAWKLDELTWKEDLISGWENHLWLVSTSDFGGDYRRYERELGEFIGCLNTRQPYPESMLRLAYIGVPAIFAWHLYRYLERNDARVVFNEIQRQFSMPHDADSVPECYCRYTYPYSIWERLEDIVPELHRRGVDGVIHYVQTFCHRGIGDIIFRHCIKLPILTVEGNADYTLSQHLRTKVEAFLDMLRRSGRLTTEDSEIISRIIKKEG
jgi:benzoyl-CoA reductase/2-hydroxyglutaryl-CoA dehydratase subunit BcrC/BadD/HgdB